MNLPQSLVAALAAAILATGALALVLEQATRPEAPKRASTAPLVPRPIPTESYTLPRAAAVAAPVEVPAPPLPPAVEPVLRPVAPKAEMPKAQSLCARHGLRKVVTRGGRSWRCRR